MGNLEIVLERKMNKALILKKQADLFTAELEDGRVFDCVARKTLKKDGIFVGDRVLIDQDGAIAKVEERKNILIRPPVANIDKMIIVAAPIPKADLYTIDKLILFCKVNGIEPVLCVNKNDVDAKYCEEVANIYKKIVKTIIISTMDETFVKIKTQIKGICVLAGQSAVGKSSIINALKGEQIAKVDTFSKKTERGKQTTRIVQLFEFGKGNYLADTAGFSKLDEALLNLQENEIKSYYPEFMPYAEKCKYKSCLHTNSNDCAVVEAVKNGKINEIRYRNYTKLVETIKNIKKF